LLEIEEEKRLKKEEMLKQTKDMHATFKVNINYEHKIVEVKEEVPEP